MKTNLVSFYYFLLQRELQPWARVYTIKGLHHSCKSDAVKPPRFREKFWVPKPFNLDIKGSSVQQANNDFAGCKSKTSMKNGRSSRIASRLCLWSKQNSPHNKPNYDLIKWKHVFGSLPTQQYKFSFQRDLQKWYMT